MNILNLAPHWFLRVMKMIALGLIASLAFGASASAEEAPAKKESNEKEGSEKKTDAEPAPDDATTRYNNWFDVSVGGLRVNGDQAQFQRQSLQKQGAFGGIEDLHLEQRLGKKGSLQVDGRGLFDNHDYAISLELAQRDLGFLRGGFKQFRSWYDSSGGFFPQNGQWISLFDHALELDRGEAWIEGGLTLPDKPAFTFKYTHQYRNGQKDSTSWGDTAATAGFGPRGIVPTFLNIDEKRNIFEGDLKHTIGKTDFNVGVRYELENNQNSRNIDRRPDLPTDTGLNRYVTQKEGTDLNLFNAHAFTTTRFNEKTSFSTGYSFTTLDSDTSGSRIYGSSYDPIYDPTFARQANPGYNYLSGGSELRQYVMDLNLFSTPWNHLSIVPSVRIEKQDLSSQSGYDDQFGSRFQSSSEQNYINVSQRLEARYAGMTNWVFYARGDWEQEQGNLKADNLDLAAAAWNLLQHTDYDRFTQKYTVGANWYPSRRLNFDTQYYHKIRQNNYERDASVVNGVAYPFYPADMTDYNFEMDDLNFRVTWRPLANLTLVSRYDFQLSTVDQSTAATSAIQSGQIQSHIIGETITWVPFSRLYLQPGINYVIDRTDTPAQDLSGSAAGLVTKGRNDYWNGSLMAGYTLNAKTDLQAHYFYYRAKDYVDNSQISLPYGANVEEHGVSVTLIRRISEHVRLTLRYGYFNNRDITSGDHKDYDAHLVYSSLQYRF